MKETLLTLAIGFTAALTYAQAPVAGTFKLASA
jgi:hypothetical protein